MKTIKVFIVVFSLALFLPVFITSAEEHASREILGVIGFVKSEFKTDVDTCLKKIQKVKAGNNVVRVYCVVNLLEDDDFNVVITRKNSIEEEPKHRKTVPFLTDNSKYTGINLYVEKTGYRVTTDLVSVDDNISNENFIDALTLLFHRYPLVFLEHTLLLPYRN